MGRITRFDGHRYLGTRDDMVVFDCDDDQQFAGLDKRVKTEDLVRRNLIQSFGPDTLAEARNRGFRAQ